MPLRVSPDPRQMDQRLFHEEPMGLALPEASRASRREG
jgi:hypothetical protein